MMGNKERLTEKHYNGNGYYLLCSGVLRCDSKCDDCEELAKAIDRLGEFEDKAEQTFDAVEFTDAETFMLFSLVAQTIKEMEEQGRDVIYPRKHKTLLEVKRKLREHPRERRADDGK